MRRVLIDECINPRLASLLRTAIPDDTIQTVKDLGWSGQRDHVLIPQIQARFDVFVTTDKGFECEHNLEKISFGIIVLETANNQTFLSEAIGRTGAADPNCCAGIRRSCNRSGTLMLRRSGTETCPVFEASVQ